MKRLLVAGALGLLVASCGTTGFGPGAVASPSPSATTSPGSGLEVTVTEKDRSVTLREGQRLLVVLHAAPNMRNWSPPQSTDPAVLKAVINPAELMPVTVTVAAFSAVAAGQAQVTSFSGPNCLSGQVCPMYAIVYTLTVSVTP